MSTARLADGLVIRTSLIARLLGIRLLRVEGTVTVLPYAPARQPTPGTTSLTAARSTRRATDGRKAGDATGPPGLGNGLVQARQLLRDTEGDLRILSSRQKTVEEV